MKKVDIKIKSFVGKRKPPDLYAFYTYQSNFTKLLKFKAI